MEGRIIVFIDGTNLLVELSKHIGVDFRADNPPESAITLASQYVSHVLHKHPPIKRTTGVVTHVSSWLITRIYWYSSYKGNDETYHRLMDTIRTREYDPYLFKKSGNREKGVDIALTKDMLVHAFNRNFDIAMLVAGDEDYVQLVQEVKRYGGAIHVAFFNHGLSPHLQRCADYCHILENYFRSSADIEKAKVTILEEIKGAKI